MERLEGNVEGCGVHGGVWRDEGGMEGVVRRCGEDGGGCERMEGAA